MRLTEALELYNHRIPDDYVYKYLNKQEVKLIKKLRPRRKKKKIDQQKHLNDILR